MSWLRKRGQSSTPSPGYMGPPSEPVPMYNPNQAFSTENVSPFYPYTENREIVRNSSPGLAQLQQMSYIPQTFAPQATTPLIPQDDITNPFKRASAQMQNTNNTMTSNQFMQNVNPMTEYPPRQLAYSQHFSQSVNLETPPENSEQPDFMSNSNTSKPFGMPNPPQRPSPFQNWQDNNETVINDRNQYLETGQLSDANQLGYLEEPELEAVDQRPQQEDALPPPGLRRMVLGQMEHQENGSNLENFNDEPPPGLSRMVLGQNEQNENGLGVTSNPGVIENDVNNSFEPISFPYGLRRMVPGESSSPENMSRQPNFQSENINIGDSDPEFEGVPQLRSATIGADTPPATSAPVNLTAQSNVVASDRSETIGAADEEDQPRGTSASPTNSKKMNRKTRDMPFDNQTNDYIEAQHTESEIGSIVASVRNMTVGENSTDETNEVGVKPEPRRKVSRQDTSESDTEKRAKSPPRDRKDRRYKGDRRDDRRERDHYSPEPPRDRRHDRRKYRDRQRDDSADYYSDGEGDKTKQDRDYDKKYYSLRKDKERDRRRKESPREYERDSRRKRDEYYHRYEDSYDNEERSRPSSRTDSMHDSMYRGSRRSDKDSRDRRRDRPRDRDRERDKQRRPRDPFNPYNMPGYGGYDPYNPYYQQYQYQYYDNLRRTNPQAYAEIYRKYYEQQSASRHPPGYGPEDRSSVHSGRSSVNGDMAKDRFTRQSFYSHASVPYMADYYARESQTNSISGHYDLDESSYSRNKDQTDSYILEDSSVKTGRTTPAKFLTAHTKVSIASGRMVKVLPNYPQDGQLALVELASLEAYLQNDDEFKELSNYPGPLAKGITHKKTVIEYCENKIRNVSSNLDVCDPDSYVLMWELLILLLRQNGKVVGTDIAELLLKNRTENLPVRPPSVLSNMSSTMGDIQANSEASLPQVSEGGNFSSMSSLKEEEITSKFREYLLYGSEQEALEWAMKHGLWGHALFLASKLGKRTHSNVMVRFANGLTMNDPLQTLYQLLSGRIPAAVSGVADEKWGDWRPHLAMMLSNSSLQPELNRKAITAMGDTLMARGSLYAAQFCYLMAEVGFGRYGSDNVKMVLLGSNHNKPFAHFATNEAVHMTEIYEYACSLNDPEFTLPELQVYKYLLATRLADRGLLQKSLAFLERIALYITNNPSNVQSSLVNNVCNLADRLKYYDPVSLEDEDENGEQIFDNRLDNTWLKSLKVLQDNINSGLLTYQGNNDMTLTDTVQSGLYDSTLDPARQSGWDQTQTYPQQYQSDLVQSQWQSEQQAQLDPSLDSYQQVDQQHLDGYTSYQDQQASYWSNQQHQHWDSTTNPQSTESLDQDQQNFYGSTNTQSESGAAQNNATEVSTSKNSSVSAFSLHLDTNFLRKRFINGSSTPSPSTRLSPTHAVTYTDKKSGIMLHELKKQKSDSDYSQSGLTSRRKVCPLKIRSAEDCALTNYSNLYKRQSSKESSDFESETELFSSNKKGISYKNEEKSHLICYKNNSKIVTIKNDTKLTKYNTFSMKCDKKDRLTKYRSLDLPESKTVVRYVDPRSRVSLAANEFDTDFKMTKYQKHKPKNDIITDTVDAWSKKNGKNVFANMKNSLFKRNSEKEIVYKPLIFGGTYPIDIPTREDVKRDKGSFDRNNNSPLSQSPKEETRPQISIPGQSKGKSIFDNDEPLPHEKAQNQKQQAAKAEPAKTKESSSGWFGGIFSKLALKPKNQMKLPDDKNPSIVWDDDKKRWVNVDEDNNPTTNEIKPPPKMSDLMPGAPKPQIPQGNNTTNNNLMPQGYTNPMSYNHNNNMNVSLQPVPANNNSQPTQTGIPNPEGMTPQSNIFKLQKSRNLKKSYIDVFNPGGATAKSAAPAPQMPGFPVANSTPQMNFFIPQPVTDPNAPTNFLTQGNPIIQPQYDESAQGRH